MSKKMKKQCAKGSNCTNEKCPFPHPSPKNESSDANETTAAPAKKSFMFCGALPFGSVTHTGILIKSAASTRKANLRASTHHADGSISIPCRYCHEEFVMSVQQQQWYLGRKFAFPKGCLDCRTAKKQDIGMSIGSLAEEDDA
jgi:hypothetical protein